MTPLLRAAPLALLLAACAAPAPRPAPPAQALPEAWQAHGRLAVAAGEDSWHGTFTWDEAPGGRRVELAGPFGAGTVRLSEVPGQATLQLAVDEVLTGSDPEQLLATHLGWSFPVNGLRFWMTAREDPARPATLRRDAGGHLAGLEQDGWTVAYDRYAEVGGSVLPHRVTLEREGLRVRLVIDRWTLGPGAGGG